MSQHWHARLQQRSAHALRSAAVCTAPQEVGDTREAGDAVRGRLDGQRGVQGEGQHAAAAGRRSEQVVMKRDDRDELPSRRREGGAVPGGMMRRKGVGTNARRERRVVGGCDVLERGQRRDSVVVGSGDEDGFVCRGHADPRVLSPPVQPGVVGYASPSAPSSHGGRPALEHYTQQQQQHPPRRHQATTPPITQPLPSFHQNIRRKPVSPSYYTANPHISLEIPPLSTTHIVEPALLIDSRARLRRARSARDSLGYNEVGPLDGFTAGYVHARARQLRPCEHFAPWDSMKQGFRRVFAGRVGREMEGKKGWGAGVSFE
ncbi:hypothetical protein ACN47E_006404 [Coniothyrium glycines]